MRKSFGDPVAEDLRYVVKAVVGEENMIDMQPNRSNNYCCGGGSGFAIMSGHNFSDWKYNISGRKKFEQILNVFSDDLNPDTHKYICAPCSNCKGQFRDMLTYYDAFKKCGIWYGGLVELIVNAMVDVEPGFIEWDIF